MKQFSRLISLIGEEKYMKLQKTTVAIIGLGGVGSYAFESIVRSGIGNITIIDFDTIDISNLNRQLLTNLDNIGKKKVDIAKDRALKINKDLNIKCFDIKINKDNIDTIGTVDYIIDAIDDIEAKIELIKYSIKNNIKIICSMGTAKKMDPEKLCITTINKTSYDPIARIIRKKLKDNGISKDIMCVSSTEEIIDSKILGSNSFVPSIAGLLCSSYVINDILK